MSNFNNTCKVLGFDNAIAVDFEYRCKDGNPPEPVCMVARDLCTGSEWRATGQELRAMTCAPFPIGPTAVVISYFGTAEVGCFLALGWAEPENLIDAYAEFSLLVNRDGTKPERSLAAAVVAVGGDGVDLVEKEDMRALAQQDELHSDVQMSALLDYCAGDVAALCLVIAALAPLIDLQRALLRGRYVAALAHVERVGIPVDVTAWLAMKSDWDGLRLSLIQAADRDFGVFDGTRFVMARWGAWTHSRGIAWPRLASGHLALDDDTFELMAARHPEVETMRRLRASLARLREPRLEVGLDGRARCLCSPFASKTGRNQPSSTRFLFGLPGWMRGLIHAAPGTVLAYIDYAQQEFGAAAALSGDGAMMSAYLSGDAYLAFAIQAGDAPPTATKQSHGAIREVYKRVALAVLYGMGADALAKQLDCRPSEARRFLAVHKWTYRTYWAWSEAVVGGALLTGRMTASFGWSVQVDANTRPGTLQNWPMQANGSEMLRVAVVLAHQAGVRTVATVHDALLIEAPEQDIDAAIAAAQEAMREAGRQVLQRLELRTDVERITGRFPIKSGMELWEAAMRHIGRMPA